MIDPPPPKKLLDFIPVLVYLFHMHASCHSRKMSFDKIWGGGVMN